MIPTVSIREHWSSRAAGNPRSRPFVCSSIKCCAAKPLCQGHDVDFYIARDPGWYSVTELLPTRAGNDRADFAAALTAKKLCNLRRAILVRRHLSD